MNQILFMVHNSLELYESLCQPVCREWNLPQTALDILLFLANNSEYDTARDILPDSWNQGKSGFFPCREAGAGRLSAARSSAGRSTPGETSTDRKEYQCG